MLIENPENVAAGESRGTFVAATVAARCGDVHTGEAQIVPVYPLVGSDPLLHGYYDVIEEALAAEREWANVSVLEIGDGEGLLRDVRSRVSGTEPRGRVRVGAVDLRGLRGLGPAAARAALSVTEMALRTREGETLRCKGLRSPEDSLDLEDGTVARAILIAGEPYHDYVRPDPVKFPGDGSSSATYHAEGLDLQRSYLPIVAFDVTEGRVSPRVLFLEVDDESSGLIRFHPGTDVLGLLEDDDLQQIGVLMPTGNGPLPQMSCRYLPGHVLSDLIDGKISQAARREITSHWEIPLRSLPLELTELLRTHDQYRNVVRDEFRQIYENVTGLRLVDTFHLGKPVPPLVRHSCAPIPPL